MASNPFIPTMLQPEANIQMGEAGSIPESQISPKTLAIHRAKQLLYRMRNKATPEEAYKAVLAAVGNDYQLAGEVASEVRGYKNSPWETLRAKDWLER